MKKVLFVLLLSVAMVCTVSAQAATEKKAEAQTGPVEFSLYYSDNATLPFKSDWGTVIKADEIAGAKVNWEILPIADYQTKVSLVLNTQTNAPDVILYQSITGENQSLALNGAIVPISDYSDWTPNFNARVKEFGLEDTIDGLRLADGKLYSLPSIYDVPFYDAGIILREDLLEKYGLAAPKTYDDLYKVLKVFKENNPDSYPLTTLVGPRVLYRFTMPSFGISLGQNSSSGSWVLSWDYDKKEYFAGAISNQYKAYVTYFHKLHAEGLLDPEMFPVGDMWAQKMATGKSLATWAYYDQIGGVEAASTIDGFDLQMYPSLEGPAGAHNQPKSKTGSGIIFPAKTAKRADFEQIVRAVDKMFYSEEACKLWCLGIEGETYDIVDGKVQFKEQYVNDPRGIYKAIQQDYGCGSATTQMVWINKQEMTKYDDNYARINAEVEAMGDVIQEIPPRPQFNDLEAEEASSYQTPLADAWERWNDAFLTGAKSIDADWDAYVAEMKKLGIEKMLKLYNDNMAN